jgi:thioredoxin 1
MTLNPLYTTHALTPESVDAFTGTTVLQFGVNWCGHCQAAAPLITEAFANFPDIQVIRIEDGAGRPLGRSFKVKLWPTLVFLVNGQEVGRVVRPTDSNVIFDVLNKLPKKVN